MLLPLPFVFQNLVNDQNIGYKPYSLEQLSFNNGHNVVQKDMIVRSTKSFLDTIPKLGELKKTLEINVIFEDDSVFIESTDFDIMECGDSFFTALDNFYEFVFDDYNDRIHDDDNILTNEAIQLKNKYKEYVG